VPSLNNNNDDDNNASISIVQNKLSSVLLTTVPSPEVRLRQNSLCCCSIQFCCRQAPEKLQSNRRELARQLDIIESEEISNVPLLSSLIKQSRDREGHGTQHRHSLTEVSLALSLVL